MLAGAMGAGDKSAAAGCLGQGRRQREGGEGEETAARAPRERAAAPGEENHLQGTPATSKHGWSLAEFIQLKHGLYTSCGIVC